MTYIRSIKVWQCLKYPAAVQLMELGLFPCAPVQPGLAVCLVMLEWASTLCLHMALNIWAWTDTTEIMLNCQGYNFQSGNSFCHHFNNALVHYQLLVHLVEAEMKHMTDELCPTIDPSKSVTTFGPLSRMAGCPDTSSLVVSLGASGVLPGLDSMSLAPVAGLWTPNPKLDETTPIAKWNYSNAHKALKFSVPGLPSDYLHSRCPCCFGG